MDVWHTHLHTQQRAWMCGIHMRTHNKEHGCVAYTCAQTRARVHAPMQARCEKEACRILQDLYPLPHPVRRGAKQVVCVCVCVCVCAHERVDLRRKDAAR